MLNRISYFPDLLYLIKPVKVIQARLRLSVSRHLSFGSPGHSGVYIALSPPLSAAIMSLHPLTPGTMVTIHPDFMAERFTPLLTVLLLFFERSFEGSHFSFYSVLSNPISARHPYILPITPVLFQPVKNNTSTVRMQKNNTSSLRKEPVKTTHPV